MTTRAILSVIGSDRPGLTRALAAAVHDAGGNWLESNLARLGGKYVGAVLVELAAADLPRLEAAARAVDASGLRVAVVEAGEPDPGESGAADPAPLRLEVLGQDRPGIVREVTSVLAELGVNIENLATATESGAWSGERLFRARIAAQLPAGMGEDRVRESLEALSGELMVDFGDSPLSAPAARAPATDSGV